MTQRVVAVHARTPVSRISAACATRRLRAPPYVRRAPRDARSSMTAPTTNDQQRGGELRRRHPVAQREPRAVDAGGERVDGEVRDGSVVGQRLHQRERDAAGDRRPRERQLDAPESLPAIQARACAPPRSAPAAARRTPCARAGRRTDRARTRTSSPRPAASECPGTSSRRATSGMPCAAPFAPGRHSRGNRCTRRPSRTTASPAAAGATIRGTGCPETAAARRAIPRPCRRTRHRSRPARPVPACWPRTAAARSPQGVPRSRPSPTRVPAQRSRRPAARRAARVPRSAPRARLASSASPGRYRLVRGHGRGWVVARCIDRL